MNGTYTWDGLQSDVDGRTTCYLCSVIYLSHLGKMWVSRRCLRFPHPASFRNIHQIIGNLVGSTHGAASGTWSPLTNLFAPTYHVIFGTKEKNCSSTSFINFCRLKDSGYTWDRLRLDGDSLRSHVCNIHSILVKKSWKNIWDISANLCSQSVSSMYLKRTKNNRNKKH
jgi:hypothetical protein